MKTDFYDKPRVFSVDENKEHFLTDFGKILLDSEEMISFCTDDGSEYDVVAKEWGFYATPSINARLIDQGFKTALVKNTEDRFYIMLVKKTSLEKFHIFLKEGRETLVEWLDERTKSNFTCQFCLCKIERNSFVVTREDKYAIGKDRASKHARYIECSNCGAMHLDDDPDYSSVYSDGSYYSADGDPEEFIKKRFDFVINLPKDRSDNQKRVSRIKSFLSTKVLNNQKQQKVLDVGAGMGVFLYQFLDNKWEGTAIEPDSKACRHLKRVMPDISVINGEIKDLKLEKFNLITLNRVLEHVYNPEALLSDLLNYSNQDTIIYLELPDVLSFYKDGPNNEAFGYGHYSVYSPASLDILCQKAGLETCMIDRVIEPSGKFTIYGFFVLNKKSTKKV